MLMTVVVPTFNRAATLRQTLRAVTEQDYAMTEIIVVDDGSSDGTGNVVTQEFPSVQYVRQANCGPAAARNAGIHAASGEIVAFTDDDCLPPVDWLARLADGYIRYPDVAGVGGYLEAPVDVLKSNVLARYERNVGWEDYGARDREVLGTFECPAGGTNNMSYRKSVLVEVGGFDAGFPYAAGEDADLKWRICQSGATRLLYVPVKVTHLQPYAFDVFRRQHITRGRGAIHFARKHGRVPSVWRLSLPVVWRGIGCIPGVFRYGPELAWIRLWAGWYEWWGQWQEAQRLRSGTSDGLLPPGHSNRIPR